jgi:hypothetical protein
MISAQQRVLVSVNFPFIRLKLYVDLYVLCKMKFSQLKENPNLSLLINVYNYKCLYTVTVLTHVYHRCSHHRYSALRYTSDQKIRSTFYQWRKAQLTGKVLSEISTYNFHVVFSAYRSHLPCHNTTLFLRL